MPSVRRARPILGTIVDISVDGANAEEAVESAFREIEAIHHLMSFHEPESDVSRLNRSAPLSAIAIDFRTYEVLTFAEKLSLVSEGTFDVTVGGALVEEGFLPRLSDAEKPECTASFRDIVLLPDNQVMRKRNVWIDLGGIAKGYAVDRAVGILREHGISNGSVNAGGDLRIFGDAQPVHIRDPFDASRMYLLGTVSDSAVASSSGFYSKKTDGSRTVDPIVSSQQNKCMEWGCGISVTAPICMAADALTKVVRLMPENIFEVLTQYNATAIRINPDGLYTLSSNAPAATA
ncbi:MAG: FAD:protein FMN transferase [Alphaproteobacteria bacterium]